MSRSFAVFILMSNYFHDVATALLLASGIVMRVIVKNLEKEKGADEAQTRYFTALYRSVTYLAWFSVAWIVAGGVLRIATFSSFEWPNAVEKHLETGLIVKYIIALCMTAAGAVLWVRLARRMKNPSSMR